MVALEGGLPWAPMSDAVDRVCTTYHRDASLDVPIDLPELFPDMVNHNNAEGERRRALRNP